VFQIVVENIDASILHAYNLNLFLPFLYPFLYSSMYLLYISQCIEDKTALNHARSSSDEPFVCSGERKSRTKGTVVKIQGINAVKYARLRILK